MGTCTQGRRVAAPTLGLFIRPRWGRGPTGYVLPTWVTEFAKHMGYNPWLLNLGYFLNEQEGNLCDG